VSGNFQLILFAGVMLLAAVFMFIDQPKKHKSPENIQHIWWKMVLEGLGVGVLTGLVGVGGGFLIVPALVLLGGLPISLAIGSSLMIIALKSFTGFFKYIDVLSNLGLTVNWELIFIFSLIGGVGSLIGKKLGSKISNENLKKGFAVFLIVMGVYIVYMNF